MSSSCKEWYKICANKEALILMLLCRLCGEGIYLVEVNVDAVPTVAGLYSIKLVNNGVDVNGAEASVTGVAGDTDNLSFTTLIRVAKPCACNPNVGASLQVQVDTAITLTNASMTVVKVA